MKLGDYIKSLTDDELKAYARRCNSSAAYISGHIYYARKEPRKALREALSRESLGNVSPQEVLEHFGIGVESTTATAA
jgi:hypothetical protein